MLLKCDPNDKQGSLRLMEELTTNSNGIQQQVLEEILTQNAKTEYLRGFLNGSIDKETFKLKVPLVDYEDIKPYIDKIANKGESNILSAQTITELVTSSGTSGGKRKLLPTIAAQSERAAFFHNLMASVVIRHIDGLYAGKGMYLMFIKQDTVTPSGLVARPAITRHYKSENFKKSSGHYTSPYEVIMCLDNKQSMYCQLLCGLIQRDEVLHIGTAFASVFLRAIKMLEEYWHEICSNIREGIISDWITDTSCRGAARNILGGPNPELADLIESLFRVKSWEGIIKRLWPGTKFVNIILTGSMAQYISTVDYYCGGLQLVSLGYGSSEGFFALNTNPICNPVEVSYTLIPQMMYFEFIPVDKNGEAEDLAGGAIDLAEVKLGHSYELVITTYTGLYRYKVGDILTVTGFYNNAPQFRFVQRKNVTLSIDTDKTNEKDLLTAVTKAKNLIEPLGCLLTDYTSFPDTTLIPGHYVLFWELRLRTNKDLLDLDAAIMEKCCYTIEESLDYVYRRCRSKDKSIGPLEIRVVKKGTFDGLMDLFVSQGSSITQYKTPMCIKSEEALGILNASVVGRFFSKYDPTWDQCE